MSEPTREVLAELSELLDSGDWEERETGLRRLRRTARVLPAPVILRLVGDRLPSLAADPKWEVRLGLARLLEEVEPPELDLLLHTLTKDRNGQVAAAAQAAFGKWRDTSLATQRQELVEAQFAERLGALRGQDPALAREVEELSYALGHLVIAGIGHDLRKVVQLLQGAENSLRASLTRVGSPEPAWRPYLDRVRPQLDQLRALSHDSFQVTRTLPGAFAPTLVRRAAENAVAGLGELGAGLRVELKLARDLEAELPREDFERALGNLLRNACEALAEGGGLIVLRGSEEEERVVIEVVDTGPGIHDVEACLVPFASSKKGRGQAHSGLGLPIVRRIVESFCGGELEIESEVGQGTTVRMLLPRVRPGGAS